MQIAIPPQDTKQFTKPSRGEVYGNLWSTKNIDLSSNRGKVRLSERMYRVVDDGDDADLEVAVKFMRAKIGAGTPVERWWALVQGGASSVSDGLLFRSATTDPLVTWTQDDFTSSPTDCVDDMENIGRYDDDPIVDYIVVARDTDLAQNFGNNDAWAADWWTNAAYLNQGALTATNPHPLHRFINLLLVADGSVLHAVELIGNAYVGNSYAVQASRITLPPEFQIIWLEDDGFRVYIGTRNTRGGEALVFPWNGTDRTYDSPIPAKDSISLAGKADADGAMHILNGKGQLLGYNGQAFIEVASFPIIENDFLRWAPDQARGQKVHPNGMTLVGGKINILADGRDKDGNRIENMPSGIWEYNKEIGLYHKNSLGQYDGATNNEWGASQVIAVGALVETTDDKGKILAGAEVYIDNAATKLEGIYALKSEANQRGYFITPQIHSTEIRAFWKRMNVAFKKFENTTDRIIVKYRMDKDKDLIEDKGLLNSFAITWVDTDTFTSSAAVFELYAEIGDEIEILMGKGAGACVHISSISEAGGTVTVNLEETIPNVSGTALARVQNWIKIGEISDTSLQKTLFKIAKRNKWIQLKVEMRGGQTSPELEELLLEFNDSKR